MQDSVGLVDLGTDLDLEHHALGTRVDDAHAEQLVYAVSLVEFVEAVVHGPSVRVGNLVA